RAQTTVTTTCVWTDCGGTMGVGAPGAATPAASRAYICAPPLVASMETTCPSVPPAATASASAWDRASATAAFSAADRPVLWLDSWNVTPPDTFAPAATAESITWPTIDRVWRGTVTSLSATNPLADEPS